MATKSKVLIGFSRMKDDELVVAANTIIGAMTDNSNFPAPAPALADIQVLLDDFSVKLASARKRGSPEQTALKDEARIPLADALRKLAYYVNSVAQGQLSTLLSSGFSTNSGTSTALVPLPVDNVRASDGRQSGQVRLDFAKQKGVSIYEYHYRKAGILDEAWSDRYLTTSSVGNIIAPLEAGVYYEFQVRGVNTQGAGDWSNAARILVR